MRGFGFPFATLALLLAPVTSLSCGAASYHPRSSELGASEDTRRVEVKRADYRPSLALVARDGDPLPAAALAVAHDLGSEASVGLALLVAARLVNRGIGHVESRIHALGFEVAALVRSPAEAALFVRTASAALREPVSPSDKALASVLARAGTFRTHEVRAEPEAAIFACSGELWSTAPSAPLTRERLEALRQKTESAQAVAFAALGPEPVLDAAASALDGTPAWPRQRGPEDPWPEHDVFGVVESEDERSLALALRVSSPEAAIGAARTLSREGSDFALRLSAADPGWSVLRVIATARPRGACLRIDLEPPHGNPGPRAEQVARAANIAFDEAARTLGSGSGSASSALDENVLGASDPREAAAVAAWRALSGRLEPGATRRFASFRARSGEATARAARALERELSRAGSTPEKLDLERRARVEAGQGELWVLLASPCGTRMESDSDAGLTATVLHALAARRARGTDVGIEPWVTPDGAGLFAHAPRRPGESLRAHAERVAATLARTLFGFRLSSQEVALARADLLARLGGDPAPGYWLALDALAPHKPSLLEPRGTWPSLSEAATLDPEARRHLLIEGPLRLAVIANSEESQAAVVEETLGRWLGPTRTEKTCPTAPRPAVRSGEMSVESAPEARAVPKAYVAVPLPTVDYGPPEEAILTELLLNRRGGWLEQALAAQGLVSRARARILGGSRAAALVIEVSALEGKGQKAVAQVRGLFERLAQGGATARDLEASSRAYRDERLALELDPRERLVELWRGARPENSATLQSLRRFHQNVFRPDSQVVVYVKQRE